MAQRRATPDHARETRALVQFLEAHPDQAFAAAALKERTGVPKSRVRRLLANLPEVEVTRAAGRYQYRAGAPRGVVPTGRN